ncbi:mucin-2-like [Bacillus rossius redtenbacheri]|uniref:mucin-2-like n=1 Tax=Bacillus rossius redtenbacheri TaxID=93214 RepID=UPI002FDDA3FA
MKNSDGFTACVAAPLFLLCMLIPVQLGPGIQAVRAVRIRVHGFQSCPLPHLDNGRVTIRSRNRAAVFRCGRKYQMYGQKYSTCVRGHWTSPAPVCVRPGCTIPSLRNGDVLSDDQYQSAVLNFSCDPGYKLGGSAVVYCDGRSWNSSAPACEADYEAAQARCDFEAADVCGWAQEQLPADGVRWFRQNGPTPSRHVGTGPAHDHTLGPGRLGYYLYMETSIPRGLSSKTRIYSPVYSPKLSEDACFTFWYHMYGLSTGSLNVYIKPEGKKIQNLKPVFQKKGEQGDVWLEGFFKISKLEVPFQIVIEGVRGESFLSDIAIDDVEIENGPSCNRFSSLTTTEATTHLQSNYSENGIKNPQSCRGRCGEPLYLLRSTTAFAASTELTTSKVPELITCDCHASCADSNTCCSDFHIYCIRALNYSIPPLPLTTTTKLKNDSGFTPSFFITPAQFSPTKISDIEGPYTNTPLPRYFTSRTPENSHSSASSSKQTWMPSHLTTEGPSVHPASMYEPPVTTDQSSGTIGRIFFSSEPAQVFSPIDTQTTHHATTRPTAPTRRYTVTGATTHPTRVTTRPTTRATTRPTTRAATRPTTRATTRPTTRASTRPTTRATTRPTTRTATRPTTRASTRPTTRATTRPTTRTATRPTTRAATRPTTRAATRPTTRPTTRFTKRTNARTPVLFTKPTPHKWPAVRSRATTALPTVHRTTHAAFERATASSTRATSMPVTPGSTTMTGLLVPRISAEQRKEKSALPLALGGTVAAILSCVCAAALAFAVLRRRRRNRRRDDLSDDSDVRFLTADEILDFTLATPKEYRDDDV